MKEILAESLDIAVEELGIVAEKTYEGEQYQIWKLSDSEYDVLASVSEEDWKNEYGMWRYSEGSVLDGQVVSLTVKGKELIGFGDTMYDYGITEHKDLLSYLCDELGVSQPRNVAAVVVDLADMNEMTVSDLFNTYE
ncbi:hypothetical protein QU593_10335 [Rossellomorea marisflavi]|uniref:hypothetical protein n=1 Tax=Rossellomorea marisflavi TaxID=189381 RepID=UPI0025B23D68|nr:hypothetical protein [Rossellomorea marisflavi]WJV20803.1 hypothetical protein QU593_10335 [Rossellomorea marisflavi]